jgi:hypothetical protein
MEATTTQQQEKVFFQDSLVTVTQSRFMASGKTYAMRNISSVSNFQIKKSKAGAIAFIIFGALMLFSEDSRGFGIGLAILGAIWLYFIKDSFSVKINSNSGEANGFISKDRAYVQQIVDAVNEAMVYRG